MINVINVWYGLVSFGMDLLGSKNYYSGRSGVVVVVVVVGLEKLGLRLAQPSLAGAGAELGN